jgi:hypothetical protein
MAVGDAGQALLVTPIAKHVVGAFTELAGGGAGQGAVQGIDLGQQAHVSRRVATGERFGWAAAPVADLAGAAELGDEPGHLWAGDVGHLLQVAAHQPLVGLRQAGVFQSSQFCGNPVIGGLPARGLEVQGLATFEEGLDLLQCLEPLGLEGHDHPPMIPNPEPFRLTSRWNHHPPFRLMCRWKRLAA